MSVEPGLGDALIVVGLKMNQIVLCSYLYTWILTQHDADTDNTMNAFKFVLTVAIYGLCVDY